MTPYRLSVWRTHRPLLLLIVGISFVFLLQWILGEGFYAPFMAVPVEVMDSFRALGEGQFSRQNGFSLATLLTCGFLHGGIEHLLFNMVFLWMFAALVRELLGTWWMFIVFFVTVIAGSLCHVLLNVDSTIPMLGASGGVMGFEGAYLALALRWRLPDPHVWPISRPIEPERLALFAGLGVATDYFGLMSDAPGLIAYGAHIGGFLAGVMLTGFIVPRPQVAHRR